MQNSLNNYENTYMEVDFGLNNGECSGWLEDGLAQDWPEESLGRMLDDLCGNSPDLPDEFMPTPACGLEDVFREDSPDFFDDADAPCQPVFKSEDFSPGMGVNSGACPSACGPADSLAEGDAEDKVAMSGFCPAVALPPDEDYDDEFVEFELAVPVYGLNLRQAVAAVASAVGEKRAELEGWGFHSGGARLGVKSGRAYRWRFLGYKNGLMRYKAQAVAREPFLNDTAPGNDSNG